MSIMEKNALAAQLLLSMLKIAIQDNTAENELGDTSFNFAHDEDPLGNYYRTHTEMKRPWDNLTEFLQARSYADIKDIAEFKTIRVSMPGFLGGRTGVEAGTLIE